MQTWSNPTIRGVQAALVTGGMLAVGSGAASATGQCPNRPPQPLGESALSPVQDPSATHVIRCFAGELFPEQHDQEHTARHSTTNPATPRPMASLSGKLDASSQPRHAAVGRHRSIQPARIHSRDVAAESFADAGTRPDLLPSGAPPDNDSPAMSWSGSIGDVVADVAAKHSREIVTPSDDPAVFTGFAEPDGILGLWRSALGQPIVSPDTVDLTNVDFAGPAKSRPAPHLVPGELLSRVLTTQPVAATTGERDIPPVGKIPLAVPGERQLRVTEIPALGPEFPLISVGSPAGRAAPSAAQAVPWPAGRAAAAPSVDPGEATQPRIHPVTSESRHESNGQRQGAPVSHITRALAGAPARAGHERGPVPKHSPRHRGPARQDGALPTVSGIPRIDAATMRAETRPLPVLTDAMLNQLETTRPIPLAVRA